MPDNFVGNFYIQVQNAANATLGQNGQGVCGVILNFDHEYVGDLLITLTSPSGQSVTLIGPIGLFGETDGTSWNITFVPCGQGADPDPGFAETWSNNQNWGFLGNYTGSYYPTAGCLENFNSGPVNGQWTLTVVDGQVNDDGNFYDYQIIFCDPGGIECFSCAANAGNLLQNDITECEGSPGLNLNLSPTYTAQQPAPPAADYGYTYVLASGGVITAYEPGPDLSAYPAGNYTVCGLSYLLSQEGNIPPPDGSLTISQLAAQLSSTAPPFCGKITTNCVNVNILPKPEDEEDWETVCAPQCSEYHGQVFCTAGDHTVNLTQNGCSYTATLHLTVLQPVLKTVNETICAGTCSQTAGFESYCTTGQYTEVFQAENGCDSVVTLNLLVLDVSAVIPQPAPLSCTQNYVPLQSQGSTPPGTGVNYHWYAFAGGQLSGPTNQPTAAATAAGTYGLIVCKTGGGTSCCDTAFVNVTTTLDPPSPPTGISGPQEVCFGQSISFSANPATGVYLYLWDLPAGVDIQSGAGTDSITVLWGLNSGDTICAAVQNSCGTSSPICLAIDLIPAPKAPEISGDSTGCSGDTLAFFGAGGSAGKILNWTFPTGCEVIRGPETDTLLLIWNGTAGNTVCATATGLCDTSAAACVIVKAPDPLPMPILAGPDTVCTADTALYIIPSIPGATGYFWTITGGKLIGPADSTVAQILWNPGVGQGSVCVAAMDHCSAGSMACLPVWIVPVPPAFAGADSSACGDEYQLTAQNTGGASGLWTGNGGVVFAHPDSNYSTVTVPQPGVYYFVWSVADGVCTAWDSVRIQFNSLPEAGLLTAGCDTTDEFYTIEFQITNGTPPYSVNGADLAGDHFLSSPMPNGSNYTFSIVDDNGCATAEISGTHSCNCNSFAGIMDQDTIHACIGTMVSVNQPANAYLDGNDTLVYVLHTSSDSILGQIIDQNGYGYFGFQPGMAAGQTYYVSAVAASIKNGSPDLNDPCLSVSKGRPLVFHAYPVALAGADTSVCGNTVTLSATAAGSGIWTVAGFVPAGVLLLDDKHDPKSVLQSSKPGIYQLTWTVSEHGCADSMTVDVTFSDNPDMDKIEKICTPDNQYYKVRIVLSGGTPPYSLGNTTLAGDNYISDPIPAGTAYIFAFNDSRGCAAPLVEGVHQCACTTAAGTMATDTITICSTDSVHITAVTGYNLDGNDTLAYVLHTNPGASLGQIIARNQTGDFSYVPGMVYGQTYYVSLVVGTAVNGFPDIDDPCLSVAAGQPVRFLEQPAPDAGPDSENCGVAIDLKNPADGFAGQWAQLTGPATAVLNSSSPVLTQVVVPQTGTYIFRWTEKNGVCTASDDVQVTINEVPEIAGLDENCNSTNTGFTVSFTIIKGLPPFIVDGLGGLFNGDNFLSLSLLNSGSYSFVITDANGCKTPAISGSKDCQCATDAGSMNMNPQVFCADQPAVSIWNNDAVTDADDIVRFILHDQPGSAIGKIYATNDKPEFAFGTGLQTGSTYYISSIAGNIKNGQVDTTDPCLSVSPGAPVRWKNLPSAGLEGPSPICEGQEISLIFSGKGDYPLSIEYKDKGGMPHSVVVADAQPVVLGLPPTGGNIYYLTKVTDGAVPGCTALLTDSVYIDIKPRLSAGEPLGEQSVCADETGAPLALFSFLSGAYPGGKWSEVTEPPSAPGAFDAAGGTFQVFGQAPGAYLFLYEMEAIGPCPADSSTVAIRVHPAPEADAGPDQSLDCHQPTAILGGAGTSSEAGTNYVWVQGNVPIGQLKYLQVDTPGNFELVVENVYGCRDTDIVQVISAAPILGKPVLRIRPVRCFGDRNGSISIDSVVGGTAPYFFSINGGPFSTRQAFEGLSTGSYTLTILDAAGCAWQSDSLYIAEPGKIKIDLGDDIQAALGDSVYLRVETSLPESAIDSVVWQPLLDTASAGQFFQHVAPLQSLKIRAGVIDTNGCRAQDEIVVLVNRQRRIYFPNIFNPGRGQNNLFLASGGRDVVEIERMQIFDRWGDLVFDDAHFQPDDPEHGWNGRFNGEELKPGVYIYCARVKFRDGETEIFTGDITLVR